MADQQSEILLLDGIHSQFWKWLCQRLEEVEESAIFTLTDEASKVDNDAVTRLRAQIALARRIRKMPYDYLGISEPR